MGFGRAVKSREFRAYSKAVASRFAAQIRGYGPMVGPLGLTVHWHRARQAGDLDGRLKCLCDALNGLAWVDDGQIEEIHAYRHEDKADPRVEVEVVRLWRPST